LKESLCIITCFPRHLVSAKSGAAGEKIHLKFIRT